MTPTEPKCEYCGYCLTGLNGARCPECGQLHHPEHRPPDGIDRFIANRWAVAGSCLLLGAGLGLSSAMLRPWLFTYMLGPLWLLNKPVGGTVLCLGVLAAVMAHVLKPSGITFLVSGMGWMAYFFLGFVNLGMDV